MDEDPDETALDKVMKEGKAINFVKGTSTGSDDAPMSPGVLAHMDVLTKSSASSK